MKRTRQTTGVTELGPNHYAVRARVASPSGRWLDRKQVVHCSLRDAIEAQRKLQLELEAEAKGGLKPARITIGDFATSWLSGRLAKGRLKPSSAAKISTVLGLHFLPRFGHLYPEDIRPTMVDAWVNEQLKPKGPYQPITVLGFLRVVRTLANAASAMLGCPNFTSGVEAPLYEADEDNVFRAGELDAVLMEIERRHPRWYPLVMLLASTGLRWCEVSALRWDDIDFNLGEIRITKGNYKGREVAKTKSGKRRSVPLHPYVATLLERQRMNLHQWAQLHPEVMSGLVFPVRTVRGWGKPGKLYAGSPLRRPLQKACKAVGIDRRVTVHGLRHTVNDLLRRVASGEVVRAQLGHATQEMTDHYSHVELGEKQAAQVRMLDMVRPAMNSQVDPGVKGGLEP